MRKLYCMKGVPGSGKSTIAKKLEADLNGTAVRISRDDLRKELFDNVMSGRNQKIVLQTEIQRIKDALRSGLDVIVDDTNLTDKMKNTWEDLAMRNGANVEWIVVDTPIDECIRRDAGREGHAHVGAGVIYNMALAGNMIDFPKEKYVAFDLDGTLSDCEHRIKYAESKEWHRFFVACNRDPVIEPVAAQLRQYVAEGVGIIIVTASPENYASKRIQWLKDHKLPFDFIFMRRTGDRRSDVIVKEAILGKLPFDKIIAVYDDKDTVVKMFESYGLNVIDCGQREAVG